jgi:hypothetical protein
MTLTSRHHKRRIAISMLLVWVFVLLSGVANACLTAPRGDAGHAAHLAFDADRSAPVVLHHHGADQTQQDGHPDKTTCQKSCDDSGQTLLKQQPKFDTPDAKPFVHPAHWQFGGLKWVPAAMARGTVAAVPPLSPPLRVLLSRLAL